jgi:NAD(P)-dependent dehydrogenase (short-subunit alcohol dehydrogenase family)
MELMGSGIHVALIEPGPILTNFRVNAHAAFQQHIEADHSVHAAAYQVMRERRFGDKPSAFTLPPEAVVRRVIHALESPRPKARYYVTFPTYLFGVLRTWLPQSLMDRLLAAASG